MSRALLFALFFAACDDHVFPTSTVEADPDAYTADWDGVQVFFAENCTEGCHANIAPLLPGDIEEDLFNGGGEYIVAGDADASLLWQVIDHTGGIPMPIGQSRLDDALILHVRDWIDAGAEL